ncbi:AraC family transcriptional regulator ligand-binding domain-containing protein [Curvibacter sp. APW13]|uniref:helix-turn-helix domain-containing protein n=1 Tax=Curvibacter sp. APW13 TaxID=3077236 RepID=UPI0028DFB713|nr:AraC family transcriptional regulator ligand-binding domain-containing protein [Curvibacter sp. APW13]MDT8989912.1 AraC family transcriptional regulator ligand-binding domain-containing protein [Curvibacter sp. APW13]
MAFSGRRMPVRYVLLLLQCLQDLGVERARVLQLARLDAANLEARDAMLSHEEVDRLMLAATQASGRSDIAFEFGRRIKMNSHDLLGYGLISCPNLDGFLRMASRHYHLMTETWTLRYHRWPEGGEAVYTPLVALSRTTLQFYLEALAMAQQVQMELMLGKHALPYDYHLSMAEPPHGERYRALAPARFHFNPTAAPCLRVIMPAALLDQPLPLANDDVMRDIDARCTALGRTPPRSDVGWPAYIMMALRETQGTQVTLEDIARRVNVSARTIDRHLKKEGTGFRELSDKVRFERACDLLCQPGSSITEVAAQLGFSDAANFSRAFKRVQGISPGEYQRSAGS